MSPTWLRSERPGPRLFLPWPLWAAALVLVGLFLLYPPIHIVSRRDAPPDAVRSFDPGAFVAEFWNQRLQPAAATAPALAPILGDVRRDPVTARRIHGRQVGLGHSAYFFARGTGRVTAIERSRLLVEIDGALVAVRTGPVFGNVVRDASGLLEVNQAPGLAEFNALSAELNRLVEERVLPSLRTNLAIGATLSFTGGAEAPETLPAPGAPLLTFIPVQAEVKP